MTDQELIEWVADMWNQRASGKTFETLGPFGWKHNNYGPNVDSHTSEWRMKAEAKVIDLSPLVGSGILCEFSKSSTDQRTHGYLNNCTMDLTAPYRRVNGGRYAQCQPLMSTEEVPFTHYWAGGDKCPVPEGFEVRIHFRSGRQGNELCVESMTDLTWGHTDSDGDIIGIEFTGIKDGYTLGGW